MYQRILIFSPWLTCHYNTTESSQLLVSTICHRVFNIQTKTFLKFSKEIEKDPSDPPLGYDREELPLPPAPAIESEPPCEPDPPGSPEYPVIGEIPPVLNSEPEALPPFHEEVPPTPPPAEEDFPAHGREASNTCNQVNSEPDDEMIPIQKATK